MPSHPLTRTLEDLGSVAILGWPAEVPAAARVLLVVFVAAGVARLWQRSGARWLVTLGVAPALALGVLVVPVLAGVVVALVIAWADSGPAGWGHDEEGSLLLDGAELVSAVPPALTSS